MDSLNLQISNPLNSQNLEDKSPLSQFSILNSKVSSSSPTLSFIFLVSQTTSILLPMGNYISCTLSAPAGKQSRAVRVIFPTGEIRRLYEPTKAAELMLETPNFFLVNSRSLHIGRRFSALNADEDLEMANVYVIFPMKRLNSIVTAADMGALFFTANSASKRVSAAGNVRILPEPPRPEEEAKLPKLNLDDVEEFSTPEFKHRISMCRSKKPLLETIAEEPVCSR